jgi:chitin disaccharide deacetylase
MLIVNADDWGRSIEETDAALRCCNAGRVTSVSAMVFMQDSERSADLAKENGLDVGLHLNFAEPFSDRDHSNKLREFQERTIRYLMGNKYAQLFYNPFLREEFAYSYKAQSEEFARLYGKPPSRVDGHHHMHLCSNVLFSSFIPAGIRIRRNFSFWPGEKSWLNRTYRALVDRWLNRRYRLLDYFFDLSQSINEKKLERVASLAESRNVELMTHPVVQTESDYLLSNDFLANFKRVEVRGYALV